MAKKKDITPAIAALDELMKNSEPAKPEYEYDWFKIIFCQIPNVMMWFILLYPTHSIGETKAFFAGGLFWSTILVGELSRRLYVKKK